MLGFAVGNQRPPPPEDIELPDVDRTGRRVNAVVAPSSETPSPVYSDDPDHLVHSDGSPPVSDLDTSDDDGNGGGESPPLLEARRSSAEESYDMPPTPPPTPSPVDASGVGDGEMASVGYPDLNYADSSVILDPRQHMMVVAQGPVDEDMQRACKCCGSMVCV